MFNISVKKEVTLGQVLSAVVVVAGFLVGYGILQAKVNTIAQENKEHDTFVTKDDFDGLRQDVRDIRNMVFNYVSQASGLTPQSGGNGAPSNGRLGESWNQYLDNQYPTYDGGAGQALRAGKDSSRTYSDKSKAGRQLP